MRVYRYEHEDGRGPYRSSMTSPELDALLYEEHGDSKDHPNWLDEYDSAFYDDTYLAGFTSIEQVHNWFNLAIRTLLEKDGFVLIEYDVPDEYVHIGKSGKQCIFTLEYEEIR